jgi:signal peptidase II
MQKASKLPGIRQITLFGLTALLVAVIDQLSKTWIRSNLEFGESLPLTDWLCLTYTHNSGSAFGLFPNQAPLLTVVALTGIVFFTLVMLFAHRWMPMLDNNLSRLALGLMLGGNIGNVIDRLRIGYVTDFINFGFWPAFNAADSGLVCGSLIIAGILIASIIADRNQPDQTSS